MNENWISGNPGPAVLLLSVAGWFLGWLAPLLFEHFVLQKPAVHAISNLRRLGKLSLAISSLVAPLIPLQWFSLALAEGIGRNYGIVARVNLYANIYAILSLVWGSVWAATFRQKVCDWLESHLPSVDKPRPRSRN